MTFHDSPWKSKIVHDCYFRKIATVSQFRLVFNHFNGSGPTLERKHSTHQDGYSGQNFKTLVFELLYHLSITISNTFQSQKQLYIHKCTSVCSSVHLSVCQSQKPLNSLKSSSFIIHPSTFIILHLSFIIHPSTFIILHSSFLHFATFKLFSLFEGFP